MYNNIEVMGVSTVREGEYDKISVMGRATTNGPIVAEKLEVAGSMRCNAKVEARHVHCAGSLTLAGDIKAQSFIINGKLYAEQVFLNQNKKWFNFTKKSKISTMEAKHIHAAECVVDKMVGTHIVIGKNASIGHIECNGTLKIHPSASIGRITGEYTTQF